MFDSNIIFVTQVTDNPSSQSRNKRPKFHLQTFNEIIDTRSLPLSYKHLDSNPKYPNPAILCDCSNCAVTQDTDQFVRLACCHTFHQECYFRNNSHCPICTKPLLKKVAVLADAFNESLLTPTKSSSSTINTESPNLTSEEPDTELTPNNSRQPIFYESDEWEKFVDRVLANITVPQPSSLRTQRQQQECQQQPPQQPRCQDQEVHHPAQQVNQNINITLVNIAGSKFLFFPQSVSQATMNGRRGSNACTFIALYLAKSYQANIGHLPAPTQISPLWAAVMMSCIIQGNAKHDTLTGGRAINFAVDKAVHQVRQSLGQIQIEDSFDITLTCENTDVPQSSAAFYLPRLTQEANLSAILIITDMTICFVAHGANIVMFDSHLHGNFGALIASATVENTENFLKAVKEMISPNYNMCSLTFVKFA